MGFEDQIFRKIDQSRAHRQELSPSMQRAHRKALMTLRNPHYAIREDEFLSVYTPQAVRADKSEALAMRSGFDQREMADPVRRISKQIAEVFEAVVLEQSELGGWFGENVTTLNTSDYDDFKNHIDIIAEWHKLGEGSQVLALGVDSTFGTSKLSEKFAEIRKGVEEGKLASIRYFKDTRGDYMGTRNNVPRTVIGVSQPVVEELANLWINGHKQALADHPAQRVILVQIRTQLETQLALAQRAGQAAAATAIQNALTVFLPIERAKSHIRLGSLADDEVARGIVLQTKRLLED